MIRYPIRSYENDFFAGRCANGDQVILGLLCPNVVLYRYDSAGNFIRREIRPWNYPAYRGLAAYQTSEPVFMQKLAEQIADWQAELGFIEDRIEIDAYFDSEHYVGIEMPENNECAFIFWWARDFWMDE